MLCFGSMMFPTMFSFPYQSHFAVLVEILAMRRLSSAVLSPPTAQHMPVYGPEGQSDSIIYTWLPDPAIGQVCRSYKRPSAERDCPSPIPLDRYHVFAATVR